MRSSHRAEADSRGVGGGGGARRACASPFLQSLVFFNHFEGLQTVFFEVELTINNKPFKINLDTKDIKIKYKLPKINVNDIVLVFYEKVSRHFWRIAIITRVLPSRASEITRTIVRRQRPTKSSNVP